MTERAFLRWREEGVGEGVQPSPRVERESERTEEAMVCREGVTFGGLVGVSVQSFWFCDHEELTQCTTRIVSRSSPSPFESSRTSSFDSVEKLSRGLRIVRSPKFLERVKSVQRLGSCIFKPALLIPKPSLLTHRTG